MADYKMKCIYEPFKMSAQRPVSFYPDSDYGGFWTPPPSPANKLNNLRTVQAMITKLSDFS